MTTTVLPQGQLSEITCQRSVKDTSGSASTFAAGNQDFVFSLGRPNVIIPEQCYFAIDVTLNYNNRQPLMKDNIALAQDAASALYNNAYWRMGGQDVSSIVNFLPQVGIMKKRLSKTHAYRESFGKSFEMLDSSFEDRQRMTAYDGDWDPQTYEEIRVDTGAVGEATVAVSAVGAVTGVNTDFTQLVVGDILRVAGMQLEVEAIGGALACTVRHENTELASIGQVQATGTFSFVRANVADPTRANNRIMLIWRPPLGIFNYPDVLGSGDYRISLNPNSDYRLAAIESLSSYTVGTGASQFELLVNDVKLYIATYKATIEKPITSMSLIECQAQSQNYVGGPQSFQFTVPPSTVGLGFFVQTNLAGNNTLWPITRFTTASSEQNTITSYQLTYANVTKPQTRWAGELTDSGVYPAQVGTLTLQQRYHDTFTECGLMGDMGGETMHDWLASGQMVYHSFARDAEDRSTQVQLSVTASTANFSASTNIYLVAFYRREVEVSTEDGLITAVRSLNI